MEVIIKFTLDPLIKMDGAAKHMFESDIATLCDSYANRDTVQISYEEKYVPDQLETKTHFGDDVSDLVDRKEITEEEYNNLFQPYSRDSDDRPIDP